MINPYDPSLNDLYEAKHQCMIKNNIKNMSEDEKMDALNEIWQNFCVSSTYEPGSVQKPFTVACGLETGTIKDKMTERRVKKWLGM